MCEVNVIAAQSTFNFICPIDAMTVDYVDNNFTFKTYFLKRPVLGEGCPIQCSMSKLL